MLALAEVLHLDPAFLSQRLKAVINAPQTDAQFLGEYPLTYVWRLVQLAQDFELHFLLETRESVGGKEAQGGFGTLPPCRFTIGRRGLEAKGEIKK